MHFRKVVITNTVISGTNKQCNLEDVTCVRLVLSFLGYSMSLYGYSHGFIQELEDLQCDRVSLLYLGSILSHELKLFILVLFQFHFYFNWKDSKF